MREISIRVSPLASDTNTSTRDNDDTNGARNVRLFLEFTGEEIAVSEHSKGLRYGLKTVKPRC